MESLSGISIHELVPIRTCGPVLCRQWVCSLSNARVRFIDSHFSFGFEGELEIGFYRLRRGQAISESNLRKSNDKKDQNRRSCHKTPKIHSFDLENTWDWSEPVQSTSELIILQIEAKGEIPVRPNQQNWSKFQSACSRSSEQVERSDFQRFLLLLSCLASWSCCISIVFNAYSAKKWSAKNKLKNLI